MTVDDLTQDALRRTSRQLVDSSARPVPPAERVLAAGRSRRLRRRTGYTALTALAVAAAVPAALSLSGGTDRTSPVAAPAVSPAHGGTIQPNRNGSWRDPGTRPAGTITQVLPETGGFLRGAYQSVDGRRCTYMLITSGGSSADCPADLNDSGSGSELHVEDAKLGEPSSVSQVWGYLPAQAASLYRQQPGQEPVAVPLWRGPAGFADINFFTYTGTLGQGPVTFTAYDRDGKIVNKRTAGR